MMLKLPQLNILLEENCEAHDAHDLPQFEVKDFSNKELIGSGSFGKIYKGLFENQEVVIKVLSYATVEDVIKEARFLGKLNHINIVNFYRVSLVQKSIMMEYVFFDMTFFGGAKF